MGKDENIGKNINGLGISYRYGINSKSDIVVRYYRFRSCWTCWCDICPQPVWLVVGEIEIMARLCAIFSLPANAV